MSKKTRLDYVVDVRACACIFEPTRVGHVQHQNLYPYKYARNFLISSSGCDTCTPQTILFLRNCIYEIVKFAATNQLAAYSSTIVSLCRYHLDDDPAIAGTISPSRRQRRSDATLSRLKVPFDVIENIQPLPQTPNEHLRPSFCVCNKYNTKRIPITHTHNAYSKRGKRY